MHAVAAPHAAPEPAFERHSFLQSLLYHLLPGIAPLAVMFLLAPIVVANGYPVVMALYLGGTFGVILVQLAILYWVGWRRNGRFSLAGVIGLQNRLPLGRMLLLVALLVLWSGFVFGALKTPLVNLLLPAFAWLPPLLQPPQLDVALFSKGALWAMWLVGLVGTSWLAPAVEELYFRGFLLPRMAHLKGWAPVTNAILFSLYHFWSPWDNLTRIMFLLPLVWAGYHYRSLRLTMIVHCTLNTLATVMMLPLILQ